MKLSTYNFLTSMAIKGVKVGYPLKLTISKKNVVESDFDVRFMERLLPKLDWSVIYAAAQVTDLADDIPPTQPENVHDDIDLMMRLHHLLFEVDVLEGQLECPETGRVFPITDGIPHMLLNEDEV